MANSVVSGSREMSFRLIRLIPVALGLAVVALVAFLSWAQTSLPGFSWLQRGEWVTYDWRMRRAAIASPAAAPNLGIVTIDESSLQELNKNYGYQWPLPRKVYGELVKELCAQGATGIAFDLFFIDQSREDGTPSARVKLENGEEIGSDEYLAREIKSSGRVILAAPPWPGKKGALLMPHQQFRSNGAFIGHAHSHIDEDGVLRRLRPFIDDPKNGRVWQMGLLLAAKDLDLDLDKAVVTEDRIVLPKRNGDPIVLPLDRSGMFLVDWGIRIQDERLKVQGLAAVLKASEQRRSEPESDREWNGKLVVVGATGAGNNLKDKGPTPISRNDYLASAHWNMANSLLINRFIREPSEWLQLGIMAALAVVSEWASWRLRAFWATLVVMSLAGLYVVGVTWVFVRWRLWIPMVLPVFGSLIMTHASMVAYRAIIERTHRRKVKSIFGRIVAPSVVETLIQQPNYSVKTIHQEMTVFFADIRGFTAFTDQQHILAQQKIAADGLSGKAATTCVEAFAAEALNTVNEYLSTIVNAVKRNGGTLDKYIGDCVMAFWGAPLADPRHAVNAVHAAVDAQRAVHALNARRQKENEALGRENRRRTDQGARPEPLLATLSLGVSVCTGPMTVGFMGSDRHLSNYTVFGRDGRRL